jgi:hypothetical protein
MEAEKESKMNFIRREVLIITIGINFGMTQLKKIYLVV